MLASILIGALTNGVARLQTSSALPHEIVKSFRFPSGVFKISNSILVSGSNLILDGNGATLEGTGSGIGLRMGKTQNVTIKNLRLKGFRWGIVIDGAQSVHLDNVDCSGNQNHFDAATQSALAAADGSREPDEGGGILLRQVTGGTVQGVQAHGQWNGITLSGCSKVVLDHCDLSKNDASGLRLWNSSDNEVRDCHASRVGLGIVEGGRFALKGGDLAGIVIEHDSSRNQFLRNMVVRCAGDGIMIRAGELAALPAAEAAKYGKQVVADQPLLVPTHPSNDNVFDGNDASFAETGSAFEAKHCFGNHFLHNVAAFSLYGFELDFSRKSVLRENLVVGDRLAGVRCDNGWSNAFESNTFVKDSGSTVALSFSDEQANAANPDHGAQNKSGDVQIFGNTFAEYGRPLRFVNTVPVTIQTNLFADTDSADLPAIADIVGRKPLALNNDPTSHVAPDILMSLGNGVILPSDFDLLGGVSVSRFAPNATEGIIQGSLTGRFDGEEFELGRVHAPLPAAIYFPPRAARYVRVVGADATTASFIAHLGDTSLALGHICDASSDHDNAALAVDGDWCSADKAWQPTDQEGQLWGVDLGKSCVIDTIAISAGDVDPNAFWTKFHIDVSDNGQFLGEQQTIVTETDWPHHPGPIRIYHFAPTQARYIKLVADAAQKGVRLQEFGVYGH